MSAKKIAGILAIIAGVALILFSTYNQKRVANAKDTVNTGTQYITGNPAGDAANDVIQGQVSKHDTPLLICMIGGIILVVVGGASLCCSRSCKNRH